MNFEYYTVITFIAMIAKLIMLEIIWTDILLPVESKKGFMATFTIIILIAISEWGAVYIEKFGIDYMWLKKLLMFLVLVVTPAVPFILSKAILNFKHQWLFLFLIIINIVLQIKSWFDGSVFYIDKFMEFQQGELYYVYILIFTISFLQLFVNMYKFSKKCQAKNYQALIFVAILGLSGNLIQMIYGEILIIWVIATLITILTFVYYTAIINQLDPVTLVFKRRCYENMLTNINFDAVVVNIDVNKFKEINDIHGHAVGDFVLSKIAEIIRETYGLDGVIYRTGGDEFCVILKQNLRFIEELNENFISNLEKE